jgi:hypothetical protein
MGLQIQKRKKRTSIAKEEEEESGRVVVRPKDEEEAPAATNNELNKKFVEEFTRKMKEETRIEAQRHLIAV